MILDGHIHAYKPDTDIKNLTDGFKKHGVDGGLVISVAPDCFEKSGVDYKKRIQDVLRYKEISEYIFPFFWIDPIEEDAKDQVDFAIENNISGFKVICDYYKPSHPKAMEVFAYIAEQNKPLMFHSGILYYGKASSEYNRPAEFEHLISIPNIRFSMAHISWPWCDELIAVYGKFENAPKSSAELFVDITPGTPKIYRKDALTKLFTVGFDIEHNIWFGTDFSTNNYAEYIISERLEADNLIYKEIGLSKETIQNIYSENLLRFVGNK